jgi:hypothetical protein
MRAPLYVSPLAQLVRFGKEIGAQFLAEQMTRRGLTNQAARDNV